MGGAICFLLRLLTGGLTFRSAFNMVEESAVPVFDRDRLTVSSDTHGGRRLVQEMRALQSCKTSVPLRNLDFGPKFAVSPKASGSWARRRERAGHPSATQLD